MAKPSFIPDLAIQSDIKAFIEDCLERIHPENINIDPKWTEVCKLWKKKYPTITPDYYEDKNHVNTYVFTEELSSLLPNEAIVVTGNSLDIASVYHSFKIKKGQRVFTNINFGAMGWDVPAVIGACVANKKKQTILLTGDGTIQFNIQELNTISYNRLPVKIFIINNGGYESIRSTQKNFFEGKFIGSDLTSGISNPDYKCLAEAYHFGFFRINDNSEIKNVLPQVLSSAGPVICELNVSYDQGRSPKTVSFRREDGSMESKPIEDQFPFLPKEEVQQNMSYFDK